MSDQRNLILAIALSGAVLFGWQYFFAAPQMEAERARQEYLASEAAKKAGPDAAATAPAAPGPIAASSAISRSDALVQSGARAAIDSAKVDGSISLKGARLDDLQLKTYRESVDSKSPEIVLLSPVGAEHPFFAEFGWIAAQGADAPAVPDGKTQWRLAEGKTLAPGRPVTLVWENGQGLVFTRRVTLDENYMFTVADSVENKGTDATVLYPYALVARYGAPETTQYWVLHEGFIGVANETLEEADYSDFENSAPPKVLNSTGGWLGITDKYWMAAIIPPQNEAFDGAYKSYPAGGLEGFQADYRLGPRAVAPGARVDVTHRLFAGAKVVSIVDEYYETGIARFDLAIDWGWFFFLTKPIFLVLDFFYRQFGNFGVAILLLTVLIKLIFVPLANTSYKAMSRMKKLQPEMEKLRERHADDRTKMQQEIMELYKREKVNPLAGCLPVVIQIPVFFSLYKVLFVTIEMRHAPFFGWIDDLAAPDPTSIFNLFGLLPYEVPVFLLIGVWPLVMGISMWVQMKMNPAPTDPMQAKIFGFMPWIFTVMLASFPVGLVIYWTWNNLLSIAQQYVIMKRVGAPIALFDNFKIPAWATDLRRRIANGRSKGESGPTP